MTDAIDLRCGDWRDVLADVGEVDAVICDPPYSERTHGAYRKMEEVGRRSIGYAAYSEADIKDFSRAWGTRARRWVCVLTDHTSVPVWESALSAVGLYVFAPLSCVEPGARVRLSGDGPALWSVQLLVARPRSNAKWGALPGAYVVPSSEGWRGQKGRGGVMGGKPLWLMRAIVGDYTNPGDVVVDPCAGGGTTLIAAAELGCTAIGAELDPETYAKAQARIAKGYTPMPHPRAGKVKGKPKQGALW